LEKNEEIQSLLELPLKQNKYPHSWIFPRMQVLCHTGGTQNLYRPLPHKVVHTARVFFLMQQKFRFSRALSVCFAYFL
jgi:hypothetical protein